MDRILILIKNSVSANTPLSLRILDVLQILSAIRLCTLFFFFLQNLSPSFGLILKLSRRKSFYAKKLMLMLLVFLYDTDEFKRKIIRQIIGLVRIGHYICTFISNDVYKAFNIRYLRWLGYWYRNFGRPALSLKIPNESHHIVLRSAEGMLELKILIMWRWRRD